MKISFIGIVAIAIMTFTSCSKSDSKVNDISSDDALISAIQKASNKQNIHVDDLPSLSKSVIEKDYLNDYADAAKLAPELGYEVDMRCEKGPRVGEQSQVYFALDGRKLQPKNSYWQDQGDEYESDKPTKDCFAFVLPVTFEMPDGTEITIEEKEDWELIKSWYESHPDVKGKPAIEFPVEVEFEDGTISTLNNQEDLREAIATCKGENEEGQDHGKGRCFDFVYPVTFTMPDDSEIVLTSKEDRGLIKEWYEAHPDVAEKPELQFPVEVVFRDGTTKTVSNSEELRELRKKCGDGIGDKMRCFQLVLPVSFTMPDDSEITVTSKEDWKLIKAWYENHPDVKEKAVIQFPVEIKWKDGTLETINNMEEMKEAKSECNDKDHPKRCFTLVLPVTHIMPDGTEITVETKEDRALIKAWYEAHPDVKERPTLKYPVDIEYKDGTVVTINSFDEMKEAKEACE